MPLKLRLIICVPTVGLGSGGGFRCSGPQRFLAVLSKDQQEGLSIGLGAAAPVYMCWYLVSTVSGGWPPQGLLRTGQGHSWLLRVQVASLHA